MRPREQARRWRLNDPSQTGLKPIKALKDELFQISACVETRKDQIAKMLIGVEEAMVSNLVDVPNGSDWIDDELRDVEDRVERLERIETRVWELSARYAEDEVQIDSSQELEMMAEPSY